MQFIHTEYNLGAGEYVSNISLNRVHKDNAQPNALQNVRPLTLNVTTIKCESIIHSLTCLVMIYSCSDKIETAEPFLTGSEMNNSTCAIESIVLNNSARYCLQVRSVSHYILLAIQSVMPFCYINFELRTCIYTCSHNVQTFI